MNKHYWDEYINFHINSSELNRVIKFHQSNIPIIDPDEIIKKNNIKMEWINVNGKRVVFSDTMIKKYDINILNEKFKNIFLHLKDTFSLASINTTLPILTIYNTNLGIDTGCYTFNFKDHEIIKYNELKSCGMFKQVRKEGINFSLSYFLSIEDSVSLYEGAGYMKGIFQIGTISERIKLYLNKQEFNLKDLFVPHQKFTHDLGLNLRKQLLIVNQFVGE